MKVWQGFISKTDQISILNKISKLKHKATAIHGEKRKMLKLPMELREFMKLLILPKISQFVDSFKDAETIKSTELFKCNEIDFTTFVDCSVIWTEASCKPQVWHMDALEKFGVVNIILNSNIATEFLDISTNNGSYPLKWIDSKNLSPPIIQPQINGGDAIFFWSDCIHRGPANVGLEDRISLYLTFQLKGQKKKITTDYAYPNWAWIDSHFENKTIKNQLVRNSYQIDFIIRNNLLDLYPMEWHGELIYSVIEKQIKERLHFIHEFPPQNLYLVHWGDNKDYLANVDFLNIITSNSDPFFNSTSNNSDFYPNSTIFNSHSSSNSNQNLANSNQDFANSNQDFVQNSSSNLHSKHSNFQNQKQKVKIIYYPSNEFPNTTFEVLNKEDWEKNVDKLLITRDNYRELQGFSKMATKQNNILVSKNSLVFAFSHLCLKTNHIVIPFISEEDLFVNPALVVCNNHIATFV